MSSVSNDSPSFIQPALDFFTETIPGAFEHGYQEVAKWVETYVTPLFEAAHQWCSDHLPAWTWIVVVSFVAVGSFIGGLALFIIHHTRGDEYPTKGDPSPH